MSTVSDTLVAELKAQARWTRALARTLVKDRDDAEDLIQDAWVAAVRHRPEVGGSLRPWLGTVVRNLARTGFRASERAERRERAVEEQRPTPEPPEETLARAELHERLARHVAALADPYRQTVVLRFFDELSSAEIARRLSLPEGTVRWRLKTGLDELRRRFDEEHGGDRATWQRALAPLAGVPLARRAPVGLLAAAAALTLLLGGAAVIRPAGRPPMASRMPREPAALAAPPLAPGVAVLAGRVLDPAGRPVAAATVWLLRRDAGEPGPAALRTGADGQFRFRDLAAGRFEVVATAASFSPARQATALGAGETSVELVLGGEGFVLSGRVMDVGAGPVAGARVVARARDEAASAALTDDQGRYALRLPAGAYDLSTLADGYATEPAFLRLGADTIRDFRVLPASALAGQVIDAVTRQPVAGASVRAEARTPGRSYRTVTDDDGRFDLTRLQPDEYVLSARRGRRAGASSAAVVVPVTQQVAGVTIEVTAALSVGGVVRDAAGRPVADAAVALDRAVGVSYGFDDLAVRARTDRQGRYRIEGLGPGRYDLAAHRPPLADSEVLTVALVEEDRAGVDLTLPPGGTLEGRVLSASGVPIAGAQVHVVVRAGSTHDGAQRGSAQVRTDERGRFQAAALGAGDLTVTATTAEGRRTTVGPRRYEPAAAREELVVRFGAPVHLAGRVTFGDGAPAAGARVRWLGRDTGIDAGVLGTVGTDGRFRLGPVEGEAGLLRAERPGANRSIGSGNVLANELRLDLTDGRDRDDLALVVARADRTIEGIVVDDAGEPVMDARVEAEPTGPTQESTWIATSVLTGRDGRFLLGDLTRGAHLVWASAVGQPAMKKIRVQAGDRAVRLVVPRGGALLGVVVDSRGQPERTARVVVVPDGANRLPFSSGVDEGLSAAGARFAFEPLAPGSYEAVATTPDGRVARVGNLRLAPGQRREGVRLILGPGLTVEGQVVDHLTGAPLAGIGITLPWTSSHLHARTDAAGAFKLPALAPGRTLPVMVRADDEHLSETFTITIPDRAEGTYQLPPLHLLGVRSPPRDLLVFTAPAGLALNLDGPGGALVTAAALPGGPRVGDRLVAIGGRDVRGLGFTGLAAVEASVPGRVVELQFAGPDGTRRTARLDR